MFKDWSFLLGEIWVLLAIAIVIGLVGGWLIWGGRADTGADADEVRRLRAEVDHLRAKERESLGGQSDDVPAMEGGGYSRPVAVATPPSEPIPLPTKPPEAMTPIRAFAPIAEPAKPDETAGSKPASLSEARDGIPDDLKKIKGVGAKMEALCNQLGFWHYDQIANWTADEVAWVDDNLEGFKGRVTRDGWVEQAKALATNQPPAFVRRTD
ncbi:NADH-quinone oxidoreductase subunit E [Octadecabacter sp. CECT 8868]|uniref:NADH-quinone oxidoreductase subunit E n=1 Tax=Octadecabacter algicola TaxID=2909342 RepID=UPI001F192F87|nr:NADH-quinone oxidoreductase subunit E [Octadecabacter algicola]MCF2904766.1 NADH-quinone oxidoreductase subunit E [Octadecabacter algicola]